MSRVLLIYRQRLGDVVGCLPAAAHLASLGHEVDFCCFSCYHDIFRAVGYCRPVAPESVRRQDYSTVYDLEITRTEYDAYRASGVKWRHYVYDKYPDLAPARDALPRFDHLADISEYHLPKPYFLAAPYGISQSARVDEKWFAEQCHAISPGPWYVLSDRPDRHCAWGTILVARSLYHLPALIAGASDFVTINSAPNVMAAGVRTSYHQVFEQGFGGQNNYDAPGQIVHHQPRSLLRWSWRFWVHYIRRRVKGVALENELD